MKGLLHLKKVVARPQAAVGCSSGETDPAPRLVLLLRALRSAVHSVLITCLGSRNEGIYTAALPPIPQL